MTNTAGKIAYTFTLGRNDAVPDKTIRIELERPVWWVDATARNRQKLEAEATYAPLMMEAFAAGYHIKNTERPVCECIVQELPSDERDRYWLGASNSCKRCGGPLPA